MTLEPSLPRTEPDAEPDADPDADVVRRAQRGEPELFELLMRRHNQRLFRVVRTFTRSGDEAEDVMQETYLRAFRSLERFEGRARFATWLTRIAIHEAMARRRRQDPATDQDMGDVMDDTLGPVDTASNAELQGLLEDAIGRLGEPFRVVFVLRAIEQLPVSEVAECLELDETTVKTRFFRARSMLRGLLARHADALAPHLFHFQLQRCDRVVANVLRRLVP